MIDTLNRISVRAAEAGLFPLLVALGVAATWAAFNLVRELIESTWGNVGLGSALRKIAEYITLRGYRAEAMRGLVLALSNDDSAPPHTYAELRQLFLASRKRASDSNSDAARHAANAAWAQELLSEACRAVRDVSPEAWEELCTDDTGQRVPYPSVSKLAGVIRGHLVARPTPPRKDLPHTVVVLWAPLSELSAVRLGFLFPGRVTLETRTFPAGGRKASIVHIHGGASEVLAQPVVASGDSREVPLRMLARTIRTGVPDDPIPVRELLDLAG